MSFEWGWYDPPLPMTATQDEKMTAPLMSAASGEISDATFYHEIIRVRKYASYPAGSTVKVIWSIPATSETVFEWSETVPSGGWTWYQAWIGHLPSSEIYKAGTYKCEFFINNNSIGLITFVITSAIPLSEFEFTKLYLVNPTITMPAEVYANAEAKNVATYQITCVYDFFLISPTGESIIIGTSIPETYAPTQIRGAGVKKYFTDLAPGKYDLLGRAMKEGVYYVLAERIVENALTVEGEIPPEPTFWETILNFISLDSLIYMFLAITKPAYDAINDVHKELTGHDITDLEAEQIKDLLPGYQAYSILMWGKALDGTAKDLPSEEEVAKFLIAATVLGVSSVAVQAVAAKLALAPAAGSAEAYLHKYFLTATSSSAPVAGSLEEIILGQSANAGAIATTAGSTVLTKLAEVFGTVMSLSNMQKIAMLLIGADSIAVWLASDNIVTGTTFPMNRLKAMVEEGTLTKEEALIEINTIQEWKDYATNFISISGIANPLIWLFRPLFMKNTELAQTNIDQIKAQVEAATPEIPPELKGTLNVSSIPTGAKIYINAEYIWETTNTSFLVDPGHHTITLKKTDYADSSQEFDIAAGETKYISMTLTSTVEPPEPPPPEPPEIPEEEVIIPLVPSEVVYNAWKVTIKAVDAATNEPLGAAILINDEFMDNYTPWWYYFAPESSYNIKIRKKGYKQGEVTYTTPALPEA